MITFEKLIILFKFKKNKVVKFLIISKKLTEILVMIKKINNNIIFFNF